MRKQFSIFLIFIFYTQLLLSDSFKYNSFNNHGVIGLINTPTARFYDESSYGITLYSGDPDQKITLSSSPFDWLEASLFYANIQDKPYCEESFDPVCSQDYKDKGFNLKIRIKEEGVLPALALGIHDIGGTGLYSSEYLVASYGINNIDLHFGLGWGNLNGKKDFKNPLIYLSDNFGERPEFINDVGGEFQSGRYFSDSSISPFFGISYALGEKYIFKIERDTTLTPGFINYEESDIPLSVGLDYKINDNFNLGFSFERGNTFSLKFIYKKSNENKSGYKSKKITKEQSIKQNDFLSFRRSLQNNGLGVNKIIEGSKKIGLEVTQFQHSSLQIIDQIIKDAKSESNIDKDIVVNYKIADLDAIKNFEETSFENKSVIYLRNSRSKFNTKTSLKLRPFIAGREGFLKFAALVENDSEYIFTENFFFSSNLKYSLWDNFDDLIYPPKDTYPAQVRSDIKDYLNNFNNGIIIGRAQFDGYKSISSNDHIMYTFGILEEMFTGYGLEYLHFESDKNYAYGFEIFDVQKRDYDLNFGLLDYSITTGHLNYYYRNYGLVPFDLKASYGKYLAGDRGGTIELSRTFENGVSFGFFASFTDVTSEQFGEGSFDKGIFFNVPIFNNVVNYTWRPLTKDPGAKLVRKNTLYDLLVKFKPLN